MPSAVSLRSAHGRRKPARVSFARMVAWSQLFALFSIVICLGVFIAYRLDFRPIIQPLDNQAIHPVTASGAMLVALATLVSRQDGRWCNAALQGLCASVIIGVVGRLLLPDLVNPWYDRLVPAALAAVLERQPVVSMNGALCLGLLALALLLRNVRDALPCQVLTFLAYGFPTLSLIGYLLDIGRFYGRMSLTTVLILIPLCASVMLTTVRQGFLRRLLGHTHVSAMARQYLLLIMLLPYLVGFLVFQLGTAAAGFPMAMLIVATSQLAGLCVCFLILSSAKLEKSHHAAARLAESRAHRDSLTGAFNRAHFTQRAGVLIEQRRELDDELSLLFLDIDHFKRINDTHGHDTGDRVLKRTIALIRTSLRQGDIIARWGGEEFVVLLPGAGIDAANMVAETIRVRLENDVIPHHEHELRITLSIGCAQLKDRESLDQLIARADQALYCAKRGGRNRTVTA